MAAPEGNQFWKLRSKHGRDKLFATPELLWEAACDYFQWCDENPWYKTDFKGKDADEVRIPTERPYTIAGFCLYCDASESYLRKFKETASKDFFTVITRIEEIARLQKFEGAVVGVFNANIIARDLGLSDRHEHTGANGGAILTATLTPEDIKAYDEVFGKKYGN